MCINNPRNVDCLPKCLHIHTKKNTFTVGLQCKYKPQCWIIDQSELAASETNWRRCDSIKLFWIRLFLCTKQTSTIDLPFDYILKMLKANDKSAGERFYWLLSIKQNFSSFNSLHCSYIINFTTHFQKPMK